MQSKTLQRKKLIYFYNKIFNALKYLKDSGSNIFKKIHFNNELECTKNIYYLMGAHDALKLDWEKIDERILNLQNILNAAKK